MFSTRIELVIQCFVAAGAMEAFSNLRVQTGLLNENVNVIRNSTCVERLLIAPTNTYVIYSAVYIVIII